MVQFGNILMFQWGYGMAYDRPNPMANISTKISAHHFDRRNWAS
jgi:hypothetical protein